MTLDAPPLKTRHWRTRSERQLRPALCEFTIPEILRVQRTAGSKGRTAASLTGG